MQLVPEMVYSETIDGPWGPTTDSPLGPRLVWQITTGRLVGDRIDAELIMPGVDWIRLGPDGIRRQDLRVTLRTKDDAVVMMRYDAAIVRGGDNFLSALENGDETTFDDQYMRMVPQFDTGDSRYSWLMENLFIGEGRLSGRRQIEYTIYRVD